MQQQKLNDEGTTVPSFYTDMAIEKELVLELIDKALETHDHLYVVDLEILQGSQIQLTIDGDKDVSIQDCINLSRAIEHNLDREEEDFSLDVASAGATSPIKIPRQYRKNLNRKLEVLTSEDEEIKADLIEVTDNSIKLQWKQREPKPVGKGKRTVQKEKELLFDQIKKAKVMINFNKK